MMSENNVWKGFYRKTGLSEASDWTRWRNYISSLRDSRDRCAIRLFALARYEAKKGDPLMLASVDGEDGVARSVFDFHYGDFSGNRLELRDELHQLGVELLSIKNINDGKETFQHLRTIHRLSGAMYIYFAETVAKRVHSKNTWTVFDDMSFKNELLKKARPFFSEGEKGGGAKDVLDFFDDIVHELEREGGNATEDSFCNYVSVKYPELGRDIVRTIYSNFCIDEMQIADLVVQPRLSLRRDGNRISLGYALPRMIPVPDGVRGPSRLAFRFTDENGTQTDVRYKWHDGRFETSGDDLENLGNLRGLAKSIWKFSRYGDDHREKTDITPNYMDWPFLLFELDDEDLGKSKLVSGIDGGRDIFKAGRKYWLFPLFGGGNDPVVATLDNEEGFQTVPALKNEDGIFKIPVNAVYIAVGDVEYGVCPADDMTWLLRSGRFGNAGRTSRGWISNGNGRCFFEVDADWLDRQALSEFWDSLSYVWEEDGRQCAFPLWSKGGARE